MNTRSALAYALTIATSLAASTAGAAPGDLDATFGTGGLVSAAFVVPTGPGLSGTSTVSPAAIIVQPDGKILALASVKDTGTLGVGYAGIARFLPDGSPDAAFGNNGRALLERPGNNLYPHSMALRADGKIVISGETTTTSFPGQGMFLARVNGDGSLDAGFSGGGITVPFVFGTSGDKVIVQPDNTILVVGYVLGVTLGDNVLASRFLENGTIDTTYGTMGTTQYFASTPSKRIGSAVRQPDGALVITYYSTFISAGLAVIRLTSAGAMDTTFNTTGHVETLFNDLVVSITDVALTGDGRIVLGGSIGPQPGHTNAVPSAVLGRYLANGTLDPTFGSAGTATYPLGTGYARALSIQSNGRVVAVGAANNNNDVALLRALPNGAPDPNINGTGLVTTNLGGAEFGSAMALQSDGAIVVAVSPGDAGSGSALRLLRYQGGGSTAIVTSSSTNPVVMGQPTTLTANVYGTSPTGTATFQLAGVDIPGCVNIALASGAATCVTAALPAGVLAITAAYAGDADDPSALSPVLTQYVLSPGADIDDDGIPDLVEIVEQTNPVAKDNDIFAATGKSARLFAMQQYRDFLSREGDPGGITFHATLIDNTQLSRVNCIDNFLRSPEFADYVAPVVRLYFAAFNRIPDYAGLTFQVAAFRSPQPLVSIAQNFTLSPEFAATYGSLDNTQYVQLLYQNVLGRAAVQAEIDYYVVQLAGGTPRGTILVNFSESPEYQARIANGVFTTMMYVGMLRRTPDPAGFASWTAQLDAGATKPFVIGEFYLSPEYHARFLP